MKIRGSSPGAIVKNQAPHDNLWHPVVLRSYGCTVSKKSGCHFFKQSSRSFEGHLRSTVSVRQRKTWSEFLSLPPCDLDTCVRHQNVGNCIR